MEDQKARDVPYSPSFILDLTVDVDERIRHVIDFVFLPGFNNPTIAVLFQQPQTWTGRLREYKDTVSMFIFTLDLITHNCPVITAVDGLPYDCFSIVPCSAELGGVIVVSTNSLIYVGQTSQRVVLPVNGWLPRVSDIAAPSASDEESRRDLQLEGSEVVLVDDRTMFLVIKEGTVYPIEISAHGRTVSKLSMGTPMARTTIPSIVRRIPEDHIFVGSAVGPSVLLKTARVEEEIHEDVDMAAAPAVVVDSSADQMDLDDDDDLYGDSKLDEEPGQGAANGVSAPVKTRTVVHLSFCDFLPAHGPISDITFSLTRNGDRPVAELVAATGSGMLGGFTLFQRDLPSRVKRNLRTIGGGRGMWSFPVRQAVRVNGSTYERPSNPHHGGNDTVILCTDANPSPGASRIASRLPNRDITVTLRFPGATVGAAPFFQGTAILHVMSNAIRVLEPDGMERQIIKDLDGNAPRPRIRHCSICDPFIMIIREDESLGLFIGESERGKIRRKDMSPMGEKIWTLPKLTLIFSTSLIPSLENVLIDSGDAPALSLPSDPPRKTQELDIEQILIAPLGESSPKPYLLVFLRSGLFAIYEALPASAPSTPPPATRASTLAVKFVKVVSRAFDIQQSEDIEKSVLAEQKRISRQLIPFVTSPTPGRSFSGAFFTGDRPCWILATDKGGVKILPSGHSVVHAFSGCSLWETKGDFILYSEEGPSLIEWIPEIEFDGHLPTKSVPRPRTYSNITYDASTSLIVAASSIQARFASYDEEGNIIWQPDAPNVSLPHCDTSTLELISPDTWVTMDGHEFAKNEFVTSLECVTLETVSTESGVKDFLAVGTTINRGEDLAVRGAVYIFEIVEVVPDPATALKRWHRLKLLCRDDAKGPVTALCCMNNYLVSSMGQKIFVRAFDLDERLVGVAFLDVGVYVTSLRAVKNLLVIGDAIKGVWFVAFQEEPYKLIVLAKDYLPVCVTRADLFFADGRMSIVSCDEEGIIRLNEYDPNDPESRNGQRLLCRSEFHGQSEYHASCLIARRGRGMDMEIPQAKLIYGTVDGSVASLTYVDEDTYKRLQLLQGQLTRNVQHVAGLNPKAFRVVQNDRVARPLARGVLDGNLLAAFEELPIPRQIEMTRQIATERTTVLKDWLNLGGAW
ncbi:hypothetical protein EW026_g3366 [Hermanssonia centrifuga]|uniref:Uncharacterized protein n=1 Tax=Hermanssonia centrifuga TaxID=98765 RepID=A0A4S4KKD1_9APHY|nr:hypothetical protein EW026_g3366 [Hermanssonia centrifuga]